MANIIRDHEQANFIGLINSVAFEQLSGTQSVSADVADDELLNQFLTVPGYRLATDDDSVPEHLVAKKAETKKTETAKERKAREAAEKAAADAAAAAEQEAAPAEPQHDPLLDGEAF